MSKPFTSRSVRAMMLAAACSAAAPAVTWAVFPDVETFSHDQDVAVEGQDYEPSNRNPLNDPNLAGVVPPIRGWEDIRNGAGGVIEEVPGGFQGIPSSIGNHFGILQFESGDGPSGNPAQQQAPLSSVWSYQVDLYTDGFYAPTVGVGGGGHGNGSNGVPDFWWTSAVQDVRGGAEFGNYLTESGFTGEILQTGPAAPRVWRMTTTAGGQPYIDLPVNNWFTFELEYFQDPVDGDLNAVHRIWQKASLEEVNGDYSGAQRTSNALLYEHVLSELFLDPDFSVLGGPLYSWFTYGESNLPVVFMDNYGVASPIDLAETPPTTLYWDTNGTTAGAGGATPSGTWDNLTPNFNSDGSGGAAGTVTATVTSGDTVVFAAGAGATGSYTVTLTGPRSAAQVSFEEGNVTLTGGSLATGVLSASAGASATIASAMTGGPTGALLKQGAGTVTLTGPQNYTGGTTVTNGTLQVNRLHANNAVTITGGTLRVLESSPGLSSGHPAGNNASVSRPSALSIAPGATLDLTNNDLILDYSGASPLATYEALVASGYNGTGDWAGDGITSSVAALDGNYVLAIADNATLAAPFGTAQGGQLFAGVDVDLDTILIKFTHRADINLDGVITPDDSAIFGGNYDENQPAVWATGDMNYDGIYTPDDAAIFGGAYDESLSSLPEPGTLGVVGLAGLACFRRRVRR